MDEDQSPRVPTIEGYPGPAVSYTATDGVVVTAANAEFEAVFGPVEAGDGLAETLRRHDAPATGDASESAATGPTDFSTARTFSIVPADGQGNPAKTYRAQVVPPDGAAVGLVLFVESHPSDWFGVDGVASVISHDLRNPLDVAKTRLRAGRAEDEEAHFDHVERAHQRMEQIIEDVLTLARGEAVIDPEERADLSAVVRAAWETVDTADVTLSVEGSLPTVVADRDRVGRIFENLFRNAVEHGGRDVSVRVGPIADGRGLFVEDDGPGIAPARRETVFRPGRSSNPHGTGLGLAIVAQIAEVHGWTVTVTEGTDGGARFELRGLEPDS